MNDFYAMATARALLSAIDEHGAPNRFYPHEIAQYQGAPGRMVIGRVLRDGILRRVVENEIRMPIRYGRTDEGLMGIEVGEEAAPALPSVDVAMIRELSDEEKDENCIDDHCEFCGDPESECSCDNDAPCPGCQGNHYVGPDLTECPICEGGRL